MISLHATDRPVACGIATRCWEFFGKDGEPADACRQCLVFRSRAERCYELARFGATPEHLRLCGTRCEECEFYRSLRHREARVLIFSEDRILLSALRNGSPQDDIELEFARTEYGLSLVAASFRPDFVVIDAQIGEERVDRLARALMEDPRLRLEGLLLAGDAESATGLFRRLPRPFDTSQIAARIGHIRNWCVVR